MKSIKHTILNIGRGCTPEELFYDKIGVRAWVDIRESVSEQVLTGLEVSSARFSAKPLKYFTRDHLIEGGGK